MPSLRHAALATSLLAAAPGLPTQTTETFTLRGHPQRLHLLGPEQGPPAVVSSGDGGWIHLGPRVADLLAIRGYSVVGFDVKQYLSSFTNERKTLATGDVPGDYRALVEHARRGHDVRVVLLGISEGAGLSVLAASDPNLAPMLEGVLALGLPDTNELGWRFSDSLIYLTKKTPKEPTFRTSDFIGVLSEVPLAALHSARDEYVPLEEVQRLMTQPGGPKRLWVVPAENHAFRGDNGFFERSLDEALRWIHDERR
ncbi:MAG: hypothetical protein LJF15_18280 [Acidobacteria bacterium]|nr:hypothetical protein [Acidobacteriota bacterium]